ncbi:MAG: prepilin peptidase [Candidatus Dormibacteria bacterium]
MNDLAVAGIGALGAAVGLGSGWLAVQLERREQLEEEDLEGRRTYEAEAEAARRGPEAEGTLGEEFPPYELETYGWSRFERVLSPLLTAVGFALFAHHEEFAGPTPPGLQGVPSGTRVVVLLMHLFWVAALVHILAFDAKHRLVLNRVSYPLIVTSLLLSLITPNLGFGHALVGAVVGYLVFLLPSLAFGSGVIGQGDAKLGAILGALTGMSGDPNHFGTLYALIAAFLLGGAASLVILAAAALRGAREAGGLRRAPAAAGRALRQRLREPIPYAPYLCAGTAVVLFNGV